MKRVLVIGCGNPLRSDDSLGWHVAESLCGKYWGVDVLTQHQLTPDLAEWISKVDLVIFIDAAVGDMPGVFCAERVLQKFTDIYTHHLDPSALLHIVERIYGVCPRAVALSVTGDSFAVGERL